LLPPKEWFFFGSYEIGEYYKDDIIETIKIIEDLKLETNPDWDFYYHSSR
jgi:hypothetical protein